MRVFFTQKGSIMMTERIRLILKTLNLSPARLADEINVQRSGVSHILSGRNKPSLDFVMKILAAYPEINSDWLMFGKGKMFKVADKKETAQTEKYEKPEIKKDKTGNTESNVNREVRTPDSSNVKGEKKIVKIVAFYSDNTFREFYPE